MADELERLEEEVGHPGDLLEALVSRITGEAISQFSKIEADWLSLMWCMDAYRVAGVAPRGMGTQTVSEGRRLAAIYRTKGNWFATIIAALLQNRTSQPIAAKGRVQGFSQPHQVDVAWPSREHDPLVCIETKVTGAPKYADTPSRGALADYTSRRKEAKFAATHVTLYRRQQETAIDHWGVWRAQAPPKTYFMWAARLRTDNPPDKVESMIREAQILVDTYLEGAGILAWRERSDRSGYEVVPLPQRAMVTTLDDVIYRVATEIKQAVGPQGTPPAPQVPEKPVEGAADVAPDPSNE